jgi:uncharacterized protein (TIGR00297 family)
MDFGLPLWAWLGVLFAMAVAAYAVGVLDFLGTVASFFLGLLVLLLGGAGWVVLLGVFAALGYAATRIGYARKQALRLVEGRRGERGVRNVMGNGAAAAFCVLATRLGPVPLPAVELAFASAVAAVAADTLAAEIGCLAPSARLVTWPFGRVPPGENGGVSWPGQAAAAAGALAIAAAAVWLIPIPARLAWVPAVAGFAGCQLDSLLGATLEGQAPHKPLSKQDVNFLASASVAFVVMLGSTLAM